MRSSYRTIRKERNQENLISYSLSAFPIVSESRSKMFVERIISLRAKNEEGMSHPAITKSARAMWKVLIGLCGLRSTLRHFLCINNVLGAVYLINLQFASSLSCRNVQVRSHISRLAKGLTSCLFAGLLDSCSPLQTLCMERKPLSCVTTATASI